MRVRAPGTAANSFKRPRPAPQGGELVSVASVRWAAATLLSRGFSLDVHEEEPVEGDMGYFGARQQKTF